MDVSEEHAAVADIATALSALGLGLQVETRGPDLWVRGPAGSFALDVKSLKRITVNDAVRLLSPAAARQPGPCIVVADRIVPRARHLLNSAGWGWLDRRGHLRLTGPGVAVDTDIEPMLGDADAAGGRPVLETAVGLDVATALLVAPERPMSVRELVEFTGRSLGAVHRAMTGLRAAELLTAQRRPLVPELFWEVSSVWRPKRIPLGLAPQSGDASRTSQLDLGLDGLDRPGWAVTDAVAANAFGAFNVIRGDYPTDFYVPTSRDVRVARQLYGDAITPASRAATVAVTPIRWACHRRIDVAAPGGRHDAHMGFVHPVVAALDLSIDAARGHEVLDEWTPPPPYHRVW